MPEAVAVLRKMNVEVLVETNAGSTAFVTDADYITTGANVVLRDKVFSDADVLVKVNSFTTEDVNNCKVNQVILAVLSPFQNKDLVKLLAEKSITSFSLDTIPRSSRAQAMDILSSMATVAGYKAVLDAALHLPKFFPMFMSAAGTIKPAKVLILGAGVAGLQAIATSRKLGAVVEVFDVRAAVKEEVQSLGGKFIEVEGATDDKAAGGYAVEQTEEFKQKQRQLIHDHAVKADVITAAVSPA